MNLAEFFLTDDPDLPEVEIPPTGRDARPRQIPWSVWADGQVHQSHPDKPPTSFALHPPGSISLVSDLEPPAVPAVMDFLEYGSHQRQSGFWIHFPDGEVQIF